MTSVAPPAVALAGIKGCKGTDSAQGPLTELESLLWTWPSLASKHREIPRTKPISRQTCTLFHRSVTTVMSVTDLRCQ
jgi:hypothetical protein